MSAEMERILREKMENASAGDVMPGFDKEREWEELSGRLPGNQKRVWLPVIRYAAVLLVGILAGGMAMQQWWMSDKEADVTDVAHVAPQPVAKEIIKTDTVYVPVEKTIVSAHKNTRRTSNVTVNAKPEKPIDHPAKEYQPPAEIINPQEQVQPIASVNTKPKQVKPVHLLDTDNEDRSSALFYNDPEASSKRGFALHISAKRLPDNNNEQQRAVLSELLKK
ncbi:MAG TPA: hypothetical protein VIN07_01995 [Flavipsychrobacter sp.]